MPRSGLTGHDAIAGILDHARVPLIMEALMGEGFGKLEKRGMKAAYVVFLIFAVYGGYLSEMVKDSLSGIDRISLLGIYAYGSYQMSLAFAGWLIRKAMRVDDDCE